jgi:hypothetical protein
VTALATTPRAIIVPDSRPLVISLCDITGHMVAPWVEAGYAAMLVDPQHVTTRWEGNVLKFAGTVEDALALIGAALRAGVRIAAVFGFPPCAQASASLPSSDSRPAPTWPCPAPAGSNPSAPPTPCSRPKP